MGSICATCHYDSLSEGCSVKAIPQSGCGVGVVLIA